MKIETDTSNSVKNEKIKIDNDTAKTKPGASDSVKNATANATAKTEPGTSDRVETGTEKTGPSKSVQVVKTEKQPMKNDTAKTKPATSNSVNIAKVKTNSKSRDKTIAIGKTIKKTHVLKPVLGCASIDTCLG